MSRKINVNPAHYKVAGRERQGEDVLQSLEKKAFAQEQADLERFQARHQQTPGWEDPAQPVADDESESRRKSSKTRRKRTRKAPARRARRAAPKRRKREGTRASTRRTRPRATGRRSAPKKRSRPRRRSR